jgi:NAD(P)H-dependent FMN reductase
MHIAIISSSTRQERKSHRVALFLAHRLTANGQHTTQILDLAEYRFPIMEVPLKKMENPPANLRHFSDAIKSADAVVFVSPEYNGSYTAALKNAIDYLGENEFAQKVVGVASITDGPMGGMRGAQSMQQLVLGVGGYPIPQMLLVPSVQLNFDESGNMLDTAFERKVAFFEKGFMWLAGAVVEKKNAVMV